MANYATIKRYQSHIGTVAAAQRTTENYAYLLKWVEDRSILESCKVGDFLCKTESGTFYTVFSGHFFSGYKAI